MKKDDEELDKFRELIRSLDDKDFDGHTDFQKLTPKQKLEWLSELIHFTHMAKKKKPNKCWRKPLLAILM